MKLLKTKWISALPALCFLAGFLICALLVPAGVEGTDGETYFDAVTQINFWDIFLNNSLMCLLFIIGCGVGTSVMLFVQGLAFGGTYALWMMLGNSAGDFWMLFAPHVFFEFIAMALAGHLGFCLLRFLMNKTGQTFRDLLREHKTVLAVTFGSVLAAALVECFVTPYLHIFA
jgi:uncharacterized membrane protein SpoIIM required for sporulation